MIRSRWIMAGLALTFLLAGRAKADYSYITAITPPTTSFGTTTAVSFNSATGAGYVGNNPISIAVITATGTARTGSVTFSDQINFTDASGMTSLTINGTLSFLDGHPSHFTFNPAGSVLSNSTGSTTYSINPADLTYSYVSINGTPGTLGAFVIVTPVPEPASVAMLGVGGLLLVAPRLRRLVRRIARA